jgi:hypothetical protein
MADMAETQVTQETQGESTIKLPKDCKENRYYYKNREQILEKRRLARLAKKGIDITKPEDEIKTTIEQNRKKKMEFLGIVESEK